MKKPGAEVALLTPSASGWRLEHAHTVQEAATLGDAMALIPASAPLHLALPCHAALLERFTLPSGSREELMGMAQLQLEKTLPYPLEEVTSDLEMVQQGEEESTVLSIAVHTGVLEKLCEPMRSREHLPVRVTLFAQQAAAKAPADGLTLLVWQEQEEVVVAIAENGRLSWAQTLGRNDPEYFAGELPVQLLSAEMEGVPVLFTRALVAEECAELLPAVREAAGCPVETFSLQELPPAEGANLLPPEWASEANRMQRSERIRQRLLLAAVAYLLLIAVAFLYLAWMKRSALGVDAAIAKARPQIRALEARRARWQALAPAIEPERTAVETIFLIYQSRPGPEVKITSLECKPDEFRVQGEAPSLDAAIDFTERLKTEAGLKPYEITADQPQIISNESTQFQIYGRRL